MFLHLQFFRRRLQAAEDCARRPTRRQDTTAEDGEAETDMEPTLSLDQVRRRPEWGPGHTYVMGPGSHVCNCVGIWHVI